MLLGHEIHAPPATEYRLPVHGVQLDASCCIVQSIVLVILRATHTTRASASGTGLAHGVCTASTECIDGTFIALLITDASFTGITNVSPGLEPRVAGLASRSGH